MHGKVCEGLWCRPEILLWQEDEQTHSTIILPVAILLNVGVKVYY